jgi:hypothetical protein
LTQIELSKACDGLVGRWTIQLIEEGVRCPSPKELSAIALALGVSAEKLFTLAKSSGEKSEDGKCTPNEDQNENYGN